MKRASKFKNIRGVNYAQKYHYTEISPAEEPAISANSLWIALAWKSTSAVDNSIAILKNKSLPTCKESTVPSYLLGHVAPINFTAWNPFHNWVLVSGDTAGNVVVWRLDQDLNYTNTAVLTGTTDKINHLEWNPVAENVLACAGDDGLLVVSDIVQSQQQIKISLDEKINSLSWNYDASHMAVLTNKLIFFDPRNYDSTLTKCNGYYGGEKRQLLKWLGDTPYILTSGFNRNYNRELNVWDYRSLDKPIATEIFDFNSNVLIPSFDADANLLFITNKNSTKISVFDVAFGTANLFNQLKPYVDTIPHIGTTLLPKRACDVMNSEVDCMHRVLADKIVPISFQITRKYLDFCEELFPDTPGDQPAMNANSWFSNDNKRPILTSLNPPITQINTFADDDDDDNHVPLSPSSSLSKLSHSFNALEIDKIKQQPTHIKVKKLNIVRTSPYLNIYGKLDFKSNSHSNLKIHYNPIKNKVLAINQKWFSVSWEGSCGRIGVFELQNKNIPKNNVPLIEAGSDVFDMSWNPFQLNQLCTGDDNSLIKIWNIPDNGLLESTCNLTTETLSLSSHTKRIISVDYHPHINGLLTSSSMDLTFKIWDLEKQVDLITLSGFKSAPVSHCWNNSLLATSCKNKTIFIWDPRQSLVTTEFDVDSSGLNGSYMTWMNQTDHLILSNQSKTGDRIAMIMDLRFLKNPLATHSFGTACSNLIPVFDPDTNLLFAWAKSESSIKILELTNSEPYIHPLPEFNTNVPQMYISFLPKQFVDVKKVEIFKGFKLTSDSLVPLSFYVPRVKTQYFQDDIYKPTTEHLAPTLDANEWFDGKVLQPTLVSLKPPDMQNFSEVPKVEVYKKISQTDEQVLTAKDMEAKLTKTLDQMIIADKNYVPGADLEGVDESEWD